MNSQNHSQDALRAAKLSLKKKLCHSDSFRMYDIDIAKRIGNVEYTVILADMFEMYLFLEANNLLVSHINAGDGLMYYTQKQAYDRCAVKEDSFLSAIKRFTELGFIDCIIVFGMPPKKHFRLNILAINDYLDSKNVSNYRKTGNQLPENRELITGKQVHNDKKNDIKRRNQEDSKQRKPSDSPSFQKKENTVLFDPATYRLANGNHLSSRTQKAFSKYRGKELENLIANIHYYEEMVKNPSKPILNHERYLQNCINKNYANVWNAELRNSIYAKTMKAMYNLRDLTIKKTVISYDLKDGQGPQSISMRLPHDTFTEILDKFIQKIGEKIA